MNISVGRSADMADFSFDLDIDIRYRDIDSNAHVNNAVYVSYLEQARIQYLQTLLDEDAFDVGFVLVNIDVNYEDEVRYHDGHVTVSLRVTDLGTSSISMAYEITASGRTAVTGTSVMAVLDEDGSGTRPIPEELREKIAAYEGTEF